MNTLFPIIRRKRRPLIELASAPEVQETKKRPAGEQVKGEPAAAPAVESKPQHETANEGETLY